MEKNKKSISRRSENKNMNIEEDTEWSNLIDKVSKKKRKIDAESTSATPHRIKVQSPSSDFISREIDGVSIKTRVKKPTRNAKPPKKNGTNEQEVWKWWEEPPHSDGVLWLTLEHNGPLFAPLYVPLPTSIKFKYNKNPVTLSPESEEIASFYAKMLDSDYCKKDIFNKNFFEDWRSLMTEKERNIIQDFEKCDFNDMYKYYKEQHEIKKAMTKEEKLAIKQENEKLAQNYGVCTIDGHLQKVGNFRIEPPGLFRGRGDHPKQGKIKRRVVPEDVTINIAKESKIPDPPVGHKWKAVIHDNKVTWLANWIENISGSYKYVMLNPTAKIKGTKDMEKYDTARGLHTCIDKIRHNYKKDMNSEEMASRQRAVALYFIDRFALRAGHEKEDGESADTVGCCSLRVEHIKLEKDYENKTYIVNFDFLGKDSVRYLNRVDVSKKVFKNLNLFIKNKQPQDDLFDKLTTNSLNKFLGNLMPGLTAKVFRTYNASITLQEQLKLLTNDKDDVNNKLLSYNRANRAVAILCNHQRTAPKTFEKSMENLNEKITNKKSDIKKCKKELKKLKEEKADEQKISKKRAQLKRLREFLSKLKINITDKEENKEIALGTSKLNYLDPRISVAWCLKNDVPIEKIYNKTQRDKFQWAIDMGDENFLF